MNRPIVNFVSSGASLPKTFLADAALQPPSNALAGCRTHQPGMGKADLFMTIAAELSRLLAKAAKLAKDWFRLGAPSRRAFLSQILSEVIVHRERVDIRVVPDTLVSALSSWPRAAPCRHTTPDGSVDDTVILTVPASLRRSGIGKRMIIEGARRYEPDPALIKLLVKAFEMRTVLLAAQGATLESVADRIGINSSYATRLLRLSFLSPEIVRMILDGRHPPTLTAKRLRADTRLPLSWNDQLAAIS